MEKNSFCGNTLDDIYSFIVNYGFDRIQAGKAVTDFYRKGIHDFKLMLDIPKSLRELLDLNYYPGIAVPVSSFASGDLSVKYLFSTGSNDDYETVFLPDKKRLTVCISSQSGCRMGCPFCMTGKMGFRKDLSAGEIVSQVISLPLSGRITHVVFMGMGEPMDNLEEVLKACEIMTAQWGLAKSPAKITVSTVGITDKISRFLEQTDCNLTVSLFSPFPDERESVIAVEKKNPVSEIIKVMRHHSSVEKRRFSLAYVMIKNTNDSDRHLEELKRLLKGTALRVNLLPFHRVDGDFENSGCSERIEYFKHELITSGISASIRKSRGDDISAACGLLAASVQGKRFFD